MKDRTPIVKFHWQMNSDCTSLQKWGRTRHRSRQTWWCRLNIVSLSHFYSFSSSLTHSTAPEQPKKVRVIPAASSKTTILDASCIEHWLGHRDAEYRKAHLADLFSREHILPNLAPHYGRCEKHRKFPRELCSRGDLFRSLC
jgi:hypothetical protein